MKFGGEKMALVRKKSWVNQSGYEMHKCAGAAPPWLLTNDAI
jgi:hypothetical protein